eukprot:4997125-Lingulodinium_polyedra.AAC.1
MALNPAAHSSTQEGKEKQGQKRKAYLKRVSTELKLSRLFKVVHRSMWHEVPSSVHVSLDAGRVGGRDSEIGVVYHWSSNTACWMPPIALAS